MVLGNVAEAETVNSVKDPSLSILNGEERPRLREAAGKRDVHRAVSPRAWTLHMLIIGGCVMVCAIVVLSGEFRFRRESRLGLGGVKGERCD